MQWMYGKAGRLRSERGMYLQVESIRSLTPSRGCTKTPNAASSLAACRLEGSERMRDVDSYCLTGPQISSLAKVLTASGNTSICFSHFIPELTIVEIICTYVDTTIETPIISENKQLNRREMLK